jgi:hypothetical protein
MQRILPILGLGLIFLLALSLSSSSTALSEPLPAQGSLSDLLQNSVSGWTCARESWKTIHAYSNILNESLKLAGSNSRQLIVSLSQQTLSLLENDRLIAIYPTLTGQRGMDTPPGQYQVLEKQSRVTMEGQIGTPLEYRVENVPWVLFFIGRTYAIHGNYWKPTDYFGKDPSWTGSHGCVGLLVEDSKVVYDWVAVGTEILIVE